LKAKLHQPRARHRDGTGVFWNGRHRITYIRD
jgi:hypothetical protein